MRYDYHTGAAMKASTAGGLLRSKETPKNTIAVDMESIPVFLRGGSILPRRERARRSSLQMQGDPFTLIVALNDSAAASGALYLDDGHSFAYKRGVYSERALAYAGSVLSNSAQVIATTMLPSLDAAIPIVASAKGLKTDAVVERIIVLGLPGGPEGWRAVVQSGSKALEAAPGSLRLKEGLPQAGCSLPSEAWDHSARKLQSTTSVFSNQAATLGQPGVTPHILQLHPGATDTDLKQLCEWLLQIGTQCDRTFHNVYKGFSAWLTPAQYSQLERHEQIQDVHTDGIVHTHQIEQVQTQQNVGWDLDRMDQPQLPLDGNYRYTSDGTGVNAYIIDTGIRKDHVEFQYSAANQAAGFSGSRALSGFSALGDNNTDDCYGHGSHVSATVGGVNVGVAKNVTLWAVRAIGCDGSSNTSNIVAALDWITANAQKPAIAVMSLGSSKIESAMDNAVSAAVSAGIVAVTAAGNFNEDACQISPGHLNVTINVAASDSTDTRWSDSDYGPCVDLYAPGVGIRSATYTSATSYLVASGTSMACPHVAGACALYMQHNPDSLPAEVAAEINGTTSNGVIQDGMDSSGTPNQLVQVTLDLVPTINIQPQTLAPAVLFEGSFAVSTSQTITLTNQGNSSVNYTTNVTPLGLIGGWLTPTPASGSMSADGQATIGLKYDFSSQEFQGINTADLLLTTTGQPVAKVFLATAYVFCADLQSIPQNSAHSVVYMEFTLVQDSRPTTADWPAMVEGPHVYVSIAVRFSHPVAILDQSAVQINNGAGVVESVSSTGSRGSLCSDFVIHAKVAFSPWDTLATTVAATIAGNDVSDVYGSPFPSSTNSTTLDHRPVGRLFSAYMSTSGDLGLVTAEQNAILLAVFSEPVTGLSTQSFQVTGPPSSTIQALKPVAGTLTYYHVVIALPGDYYGNVTVSLTGTLQDAGQRTNQPITPLSFTRVAEPLMKGTGYQLLKTAALQTTS
ncbi:hypothetical protein WJX84_003473 [Apatococcus fuscideae]|uniref:Peptidase S8/S53 domain-containing protein n=1 Tax=Apatococcus fuscideae TaxID=2026836 RepID=A0AAW1T6V9_9CHLO